MLLTQMMKKRAACPRIGTWSALKLQNLPIKKWTIPPIVAPKNVAITASCPNAWKRQLSTKSNPFPNDAEIWERINEITSLGRCFSGSSSIFISFTAGCFCGFVMKGSIGATHTFSHHITIKLLKCVQKFYIKLTPLFLFLIECLDNIILLYSRYSTTFLMFLYYTLLLKWQMLIIRK